MAVGHRLCRAFFASRGVYALYAKITPVFFNPSQHICHQLQEFGLNIRELEGVIISHFHADHIAGLKDFANIALIGRRLALDFLRPLKGIKALKQGFLPDLMPTDTESRFVAVEQFLPKALPQNLCLDMPHAPKTAWELPHSNGEILLVPLDGHAIGQIGAFVLTDTGWELIGSDSAWSAQNFLGSPPAKISHLSMHDVPAFYRTLSQLSKWHGRGVAIHLSHEFGEKLG
ncbi:MBL fold metallo-hydrolase [Moraxella bovis]|uniref:Ribonuclease Z n=1 Tax=Moraxella bovis TaxID=476 RepID=A0A378PRT7_MORBO|nr:MBL fold metallo-hydrolase [Moraxella bovis]UZA17206.1 MBL fold metallo-hydrolase [Moraxella bovis]STY91225.1 ribonuclease Z [Moraxella bovis]